MYKRRRGRGKVCTVIITLFFVFRISVCETNDRVRGRVGFVMIVKRGGGRSGAVYVLYDIKMKIWMKMDEFNNTIYYTILYLVFFTMIHMSCLVLSCREKDPFLAWAWHFWDETSTGPIPARTR